MIEEPYLSIIVVAAGILILSGWVKQIHHGFKTKSLKDVSKYLMVLIFAGAVLWLIYGVEIEDWFIVGTNVAAIALMVIILSMKTKYERGGNSP